ncbi:MAG: hypothetical protein COV29_03285 [Candidatus Yanofskybacteria bacterium CG10_big_fil_rev_8_21_14_0_10_36_16]|uniref:Uncharacterized protein n=1 Tax=Candidatus Yanofskybacteria bacterium CG10_big_fil_rev_8_21_14_0_10_36_16 TaxID=1975096 RepID=A0A2J0Q747_9BACT|nr:MAG: hypothetical protein COV29_03285 [Candidatus Yanofskybacteria bacterium CG10_big_fil_rev_8_21_14_0_10_36_16]
MVENSFILILLPAILFPLLLVLRSLLKTKFCVICASVVLSWAGLLLALHMGYIYDKALVALFMGQSVTGFYYFVDGKVDEKLKLFRLPFLITLAAIAYTAIYFREIEYYAQWYFLAVLWGLFAAVYIFRNVPVVSTTVKKIIECCKNW